MFLETSVMYIEQLKVWTVTLKPLLHHMAHHVVCNLPFNADIDSMVSRHRTVVNVFKNILNVNPFFLGRYFNLNLSVTDGLT